MKTYCKILLEKNNQNQENKVMHWKGQIHLFDWDMHWIYSVQDRTASCLHASTDTHQSSTKPSWQKSFTELANFQKNIWLLKSSVVQFYESCTTFNHSHSTVKLVLVRDLAGHPLYLHKCCNYWLLLRERRWGWFSGQEAALPVEV